MDSPVIFHKFIVFLTFCQVLPQYYETKGNSKLNVFYMDRLKKIRATALREDSKMIFDPENYRCRHYYSTLIKFIYERPKKWVMLEDTFNLTEEQLSKTYLLLRVALHFIYERCSFQNRIYRQSQLCIL